jgi:hypothetical protein
MINSFSLKRLLNKGYRLKNVLIDNRNNWVLPPIKTLYPRKSCKRTLRARPHRRTAVILQKLRRLLQRQARMFAQRMKLNLRMSLLGETQVVRGGEQIRQRIGCVVGKL